MSTRPTLSDFIDDELLRAPMSIDQVIDAVHERWRSRMPHLGRNDADPARVLHHHRGEVTAKALQTLRTAVMADLAAQGKAAATTARPGAGPALSLALIEEDDVAVDIEIARCTETVKLQAETVLRELQTYTSTLVNDPNVSRDSNPFRPERFVRALWAGVQTLPLSRHLMAAFLHDAAEPLAATLRRGYAAACLRLEEQGVAPAAYRTIVVSGSTAWGTTGARYQPPHDLHSLRGSMPAALDGLSPHPGGEQAQAQPAPDPQLIELLARLFEAIQTEFNLSTDTVTMLQRLQPTALRVALRDPSLLDRYDHALWRFMDQLAHDIETSPPSQRQRLLGLGRNLVDHLAQVGARDSHGFAWALERLLAAQRHFLNQTTAAATPAIARLQRQVVQEADAAIPPTSPMPLDIGTLDTIPAELMPDLPTASAASAPLASTGVPQGTAIRAYLQGEWRMLVSLWQDDEHELALLSEPATDSLWAVRQSALSRLQQEGLARPFRVRSLVRRAAEKVLRAL